jgi:hypothetical protein
MEVDVEITGNTTVGEVVILKGKAGAKLLDDFFCLDGKCCPGTTHSLSFAAHIREKTGELPGLIFALVQLPNRQG